MSDSCSTPSSPALSDSTLPTSGPPSPGLLSQLNLQDVSEEAKQEAAKVKVEANKAFMSMQNYRHLLIHALLRS